MSPAAPALPRRKLPIGLQNLREIRPVRAHRHGGAGGRGEPIHLTGVEFGKTDRNIVGFEVETR
ncbi:hypothetical protein [Sphaerotilus sp.]|uniref:hypothetical protein n=1 Tax=Sphaerotilus sp. TaxID=2093942 RepID=UPI0034E1A913